MWAFRATFGLALVVCSYMAFTPRQFSVIRHIYDKALHASAFCTLAFLADFAFPRSRFVPAKALSLVGYGILIEVVQHFLPYRSAEVLDVLADVVGLVVYAVMIPLLHRVPILRARWNGRPVA
jgi:VanZ family protein